MDDQEKTCVVEGKGIGTVCSSPGGISLSLTDDARERIKKILEFKKPNVSSEMRTVIDQRIKDIDDESKMAAFISSDEIKMMGAFPANDSKKDSVLAISFDDGVSKRMNLAQPFTMIAMSNDDVEKIKKNLPTGVKLTDRMETFQKSVSK